MVPPTDRTTPQERVSGARAEGQRLIRGAAAPEQTATPDVSATRLLVNRKGQRSGPVVSQAEADVVANRRAQQIRGTEEANFSPEHWMDVARRGMELGSTLHAQGRHDEAEDVLRKAYNAQLLGQNSKTADTASAIALSNLFGMIHDPHAGERRNIAEAAQPGMTFTPDEQRQMGTTGARPERGFDIGKDIAAPLAGQLPVFIAGGAVGRGAAAVLGAGAERAGLRGVAGALGRLAEPIEVAASPASAGRTISTMGELGTRIADEVATLRVNLPKMAARGATEGQIVGGIQQYRMAREQGATVEQALTAVSEGMGFNVPMGVLGEIGLGMAGRTFHLGYDPIGRAAGGLRERLRPDARFEEPVLPADRRAGVAGRFAGDERLGPGGPPRGEKLGEVGAALEDIFAQKRGARQGELADVFAQEHPGERPAGPEWWEQGVARGEVPRMDVGEQRLGPEPLETEPGMVEPGRAYRTRQPEENPPLRTAADVAMDRARPTDEENAVVRMRRAEQDARTMDEARRAEENDPDIRLERAAQERPGEQQGPLTLSETLEHAGRAAEEGEPMAADYHEAVNKYVDALASTKDTAEGKEPSTRQQVALARARQALNAARKKYGMQFGASAVLALAANDDDLTDEEKKMVGMGGIAMLSTAIVPHGEGGALAREHEPLYSRVRKAIENKETFGKKWDEPRPAMDWISKLGGSKFSPKEAKARRAAVIAEHPDVASMSVEELRTFTGKSGDLPEEKLREIAQNKVANAVSATMRKEGYETAPVGMSLSELELLMPELRKAAAEKRKLSRADLIALAEEKLPRIERVTLGTEQRELRPDEDADGNFEGDAEYIVDLAEISNEDRLDPEYVQQQIANREARIRDIETHVENDQERAADEVRETEHSLNQAEREVDDLLEEFGLNRGTVDDALEYIRSRVEGEHVPHNTVRDAIHGERNEPRYGGRRYQGILDDVLLDTDPEEAFKDADYSVEEVEMPTINMTWTGRDGSRYSEDVQLEPREGNEEAYQWLKNHSGPADFLPAFDDITFEDGGSEAEFRAFDHNGRQVGNGPDREELMRSVTEDFGLGDDRQQEFMRRLESELDGYAGRYSDWSQAESEHSYRTDGDAFQEENDEIDALKQDIDDLNEMHETAQAHQERRALMEDETAQRRAMEAAGQETLFPDHEPTHGAADAHPPGEPVAIVEVQPEPAEDPLKPIIRRVYGRTIYSSNQRIGGGEQYSEIISNWENVQGGSIPRRAYGDHDYWRGRGSYDVPAAVGHIRREIHRVYETPDLMGPEVEFHAGEPEVERTTKAHIVDLRRKRDTDLRKMGELGAEFDRLPPAERDPDVGLGPRAQEIATEYNELNQHVSDLSTREDELATRLRGYRGDTSEPKPVNIAIESQASLAQHQVGIDDIDAPTPEAVTELRQRLADIQQNYRALNRDYADEMGALNSAENSYREMTDERTPEGKALRAKIHQEMVTRAGDESGRWELHTRPSDLRLPTGSEILNAHSWEDTWNLMRDVDPDLRDIIDRLRESRQRWNDFGRQLNVTRDEMSRRQNELLDAQARQREAPFDVGPFGETSNAQRLNAAVALLDTAERGVFDFAWSDSANRIRNAMFDKQAAARLWYDNMFKSGVEWQLSQLEGGRFKNQIKFDKIWIKGNGHWHITLTPDMIRAIRRAGLPILGLLAFMAPSDAQAQSAQDGDTQHESPYATALGGVVAGAALMYLAGHRKVRRIIKENRALERALNMDELSGLANKRAWMLARPSVDADEAFHWVVFDGDRFKKLNDTHGHAEGDKAIRHFGTTVMQAAKEMGIPMRGFRPGGDEIAFAAPAEHAAEFLQRVEAASPYSKGDVTTKLTGGKGRTFEEADADLTANKNAAKAGDPTLRRTPLSTAAIVEQAERLVNDAADKAGIRRPLDLHANPIPQALREVAKYPSAALLTGVGAMLADSDDKDIRRTALPVFALAALSAIGSRRIRVGVDKLAETLVEQMRKSTAGTTAARFFNPDALLTPEVKEAVLRYESDRARAAAKAAEFSRRGQALGPAGDRAVSDVIEGEQWEDTSSMSSQDLQAVLTVASALDSEYQSAAAELLATGARTPEQLLANYAGPRRYAYYEAQAAQAEGPNAAVGGTPRIKASQHRTLDEPIRKAEAALQDAQTAGDPQAISDAQDALDEAKAVQMSRRVELGEIRESSYRSAQGIERAYGDAAAARLFETLRNSPGVVHPEWEAAITDLQTAKALRKSATTPADRDAATTLVNEALVRIEQVTRQFQREGGDFVSLPNTRGLGLLRGAVVQRDVANTLNGFATKGKYAKLLRAWKEIKTVFNPGTHQGNILSNISFAHMEGLHLWEQPLYLKRAAKDMRGYGDATRALAEAGILDVNAVSAEGEGVAKRDYSRTEGLEQLVTTTRPETADVLRREGITEVGAQRKRSRARLKGAAAGAALGAAKMYDSENPEDAALGAAAGALLGGTVAGLRARKIRTLYNNEDNIFRAAIWLKKRAGGMSPAEATTYTRNALGNFRTRSPALNMARSTIAPFVLYPAKALPRFAAQVIDHPWRYMTLVALWGGLNEYAESEVGEVADSDLRIADRRRLGYFLPGFTQLPFSNARGDKAGVDVARWTPMSAITTAAPPGSVPASFDERLPDIFRAGGPVVDLAARFGANVDPYSGKPAYARDYPVKENVASLLNDVSGTMLPSALDFHTERIKEDIENRDFDKLKNDALGPTGLRPRFVRPGANLRDASNQLENSLREMKQDFRRSMINNQNQQRVPVLRDRYFQRVHQALTNYRERNGQEPPPDVVRAAMSPPDE